MYLGVIADDLTGATDIALTLAREGMRVVQTVGVPGPDADFGTAEAVVVSLKSRTVPAAEAVAQSLASARRLLDAGASQLFFKYCSTFDSTDAGNIGPVIDALLDLLGEQRTLACPAFPANGRTVYMGNLFVGEQLLSESSMKDHPLTPMRDANLVRVLLRQTQRPVSLIAHPIVHEGGPKLDQALHSVPGIAIIDAIDEADLRAIGRAARDLRLVTGGSGVALGLPANFLPGVARARPDHIAPAPGRSIVLAGSCSAATRRQIQTAIAAGAPALQISPLALANATLDVNEVLTFASRSSDGLAPIIYSSADPAEVALAQQALGRDAAGELIERFLGQLAQRLLVDGFSRFIIAGGETSGAVVSALDIKTLAIGPEIDPGVPWTTFDHGGRTIALALKSGNFGTDDFFLKAWSQVS